MVWGSPAVVSAPLSDVNQWLGLFWRRKTLLNKCKGQAQPLHCQMTCYHDNMWFWTFVKHDFMWMWQCKEFTRADLLLFLCISTKQLCNLFILVVSICLCLLGFHGTTCAAFFSIYTVYEIEHYRKLLEITIYAFVSLFFPYLLHPTIKITFTKLPSPNHYGTFAANYPENVFLVP